MDRVAVSAAVRERASKIDMQLKLKDKQVEAVCAFVEGKDTLSFVALPAGYGKSLIYGILPYVFDKLKGNLYIL